jgi:branched-chain amino acid transport system substrate-binding protein
MPKFADFDARFQKAYGKIVAFAPYAYDATMLIAKAMQDAKSTDPRVYGSVLANEQYNGITGLVKFAPNGDNANGTVVVYQVKNGELVPLP